MRTSTLLAVLVLLATGLAACGAQAPKSSAPTTTEPGTSPYDMQRQTPHDQIETLSQQIGSWRGQMGLPAQPDESVTGTAGAEPVRQPMAADDVEAIEDPTCRDVCTLAASICDNAGRICRIAEEDLAGDEWAAGKCTEAKASCAEAQDNCDACAGE